MHNRLRLLQFGTAMLYLGPLLAGLAGQGWAMVAAFTLVFGGWSMVVRPRLWPRSASEFEGGEAAVALATLVAGQMLLVVVSFGIGRGMGGVLAFRPDLPQYLPLLLSLLAVPVSRVGRGPVDRSAPIGFDPAPPDDSTASIALAETLLAEVMALPADVAEDVLQNHLTAISSHLDPVLIRASLGAAIAAGRATRAGTMALIIHATDPAISDLLSGSAYPAQAFAAAGHDADLLALFARRCTRLLGDEPELGADCPPAAVVAQVAADCRDPVTAAALHRLAGLLV